VRIADLVTVSLAVVLTATLGAGCDIATDPSSPSGSTGTAPLVTLVATPMLTMPVPTPEPTFLIYQVRANDALEAIAKRFRTTVDSIGYWNRERYATLDPDTSRYAPSSIQVGWLLRIHPGQTTDGDDGAPIEGPSGSASPST
jgi:hypothetical protein